MNGTKKVSDDDLLSTIKEHKALSQLEIEKMLGYGKGSLHPRLYRLVRNKKLKSKRLPLSSHHTSKYPIFKGYSDVTIYFVRQKDLVTWIKEYLPVDMPRNYRRIVSMALHNIGIDMDISPRRKSKLIPLSLHLHKNLKKLAEKKGVTLQDMLDKVVSLYLKKNK